MRKLNASEVVIPAQALGELFYVLVRKAGRSAAQARAAILAWQDMADLAATSATSLSSAIDLAAGHHFSIWDSIILSAAAAAQCRMLLSVDLHNGFTWGGVTVCNPFSSSPHPLLESVYR